MKYGYVIRKTLVDEDPGSETLSLAYPPDKIWLHQIYYTTPRKDPFFNWLFYDEIEPLDEWLREYAADHEIDPEWLMEQVYTGFDDDSTDYLLIEEPCGNSERAEIDPYEDGFDTRLRVLARIAPYARKANAMPLWLEQMLFDWAHLLNREGTDDAESETDLSKYERPDAMPIYESDRYR